MRTLTRTLMSGLFATSLTLFACSSDDDDSGTTDTGQPEATAETTTAPPDTTPAETTPEETVAETTEPPPDTVVTEETVEDTTPAETTAEGACTNEADLAVITSGDMDPAAKASECGGSSCIGELFNSIDAFRTCVATCMQNDALPGYEFAVSEECGGCYTDSVVCTAEFCGLNDPNLSCVPASFGGKGTDSADCEQCRSDNNCDTSFYDCSGLTP